MISQFFVRGHTIPWRPYLSEALQQYAERNGDTSQAKDYTNYAIILQQVHYWTDPYREYKSQEYRPEYARRPGDIPRFWIYRTWADWHRDIFTLHVDSLRRCFYRLRDWGILLNVQPDNPNWQGQFWAINHEHLDEIFAETRLPSYYKDGNRMPESVLNSVFEEVDNGWYDRPVSDRFNGIKIDQDEENEFTDERMDNMSRGGGRMAHGGVDNTPRGGWAVRAGGTSIIEDHFIDVNKDHDHEDASASVSDMNDVSDVISSSLTLDLSDEDKATNAAMLRDKHFGLNWSQTTAKLAECYTPEQICAVLIRGSDNHRAGKIQNLAGWIIKVLKSPEPDIIKFWDEDTNHWIYKKHILKQEPNTAPVNEDPPLVPPYPPLANNGNEHTSTPTEKSINEAQQLWANVLHELALQMPTPTYDTWVKDTSALSYEDGQFIVGVPNAYARDWLEHRLKTIIGRALSHRLNRAVEILFRVRDP
jgi:hypothetical protein